MNEDTQNRLSQDADHDLLLPPGGAENPTDAGAYIGHEPELARETIPGGVQRGDVRIAGVATRSSGVGDDARARMGIDPAGGHRQGPAEDEDTAREAGQNH
jgi:hypothetical protein